MTETRVLESKPLSLTELTRLSRSSTEGMKGLQMAVLADCSSQWLSAALIGYGRAFGLNLSILKTPLYQVQGEIYRPDSELYTKQPNYILVFESSQKLLDAFRQKDFGHRATFAADYIEEARGRIGHLRAKCPSAKILWMDLEPCTDGVFGNFAAKHRHSFDYQLTQLTARLYELVASVDNVYVVPFGLTYARAGTPTAFDSRLDCMADCPISMEFTPSLARQVVRMISTLEGRLCKCLVLDLDNTLWGGTVGDLGPEGIEISDIGPGKAYLRVQNWALELKRRGILLAVCSKNTEELALAPFAQRSDLPLRREDFAAFIANWEPKYSNIANIAKQLNIGLDSLVFVDDNPVERDSVRRFLPEVVVPELPSDPSDYANFLTALQLFDVPQLTEEDAVRTELYRAEASRQQVQSQFDNLSDYLASLNMQGTFLPATGSSLKRIAQLFQKSNQFNLRTIRYSDADILGFSNSPTHRVFTANLLDRFGDYGLISALVLSINGPEAFLENWVTSCRVFNRGLEDFILEHLSRTLLVEGVEVLRGEYLPTAKNGVVARLFATLGFSAQGDQWVLPLRDYAPQSHQILRREGMLVG